MAAGCTTVETDADAAVVPCHLAPPATLTSLDGKGWATSVEQPLRRTLAGLIDGRRRLRQGGGSIVVVIPNVGTAGAAGMVALTTVAEGVRSMAKSAARQWAGDGVQVNLLSLPLAVLDPTYEPYLGHLPPPVGRPPSADDIGSALLPMLQASEALVGATLLLDGGSVMSP